MKAVTKITILALSIWSAATLPTWSGTSCLRRPNSEELGIESPEPARVENHRIFRRPTPISLLPKSEFGYTTSGHPTIFVYVPKTDFKKIRFSISNEDWIGHYSKKLETSGEEGIVAIALPPDLPELENGKLYRWFFVLYDDILTPNDIFASGQIMRVEAPAIPSQISGRERAKLYAQKDFWYDALKALWSPERTGELKIEEDWQQTLISLGLSNVMDEIFNYDQLPINVKGAQ